MLFINSIFGNNKDMVSFNHHAWSSRDEAWIDTGDVVMLPAGVELGCVASDYSLQRRSDTCWEAGPDDGTLSVIVPMDEDTRIWTTSQTGKLATYGNLMTADGRIRAVLLVGLEPKSMLCFARMTGPASTEVTTLYAFNGSGHVTIVQELINYQTTQEWRELRLDSVNDWWERL